MALRCLLCINVCSCIAVAIVALVIIAINYVFYCQYSSCSLRYKSAFHQPIALFIPIKYLIALWLIAFYPHSYLFDSSTAKPPL